MPSAASLSHHAGRHQRPARIPSPPRGAVLTILGIAQLLTVLDIFIINVALPTIERELTMSAVGIEWAISGYALAFGTLLPLGGRLADALGPRRAMVFSVVGFAIASAIAGASANGTMFIVARCAQGAFAAMLAPSSQAMVVVSYPDTTQRSRAFGIFGAIGALGGAVGMLLGGIITDHLSWRWTMYINVIFAAVIIAGTYAWMRRDDPTLARPRIKIPGTALLTIGLLAVVYSFSRAGQSSWTDTWTLVALLGGIGCIAVFFTVQRRSSDPLLPTQVFRSRVRLGAFTGMFAIGFASVAQFVFLNFYLQNVGDYTPTTAGLAYVPVIGMQVLVTAIVLRWCITRLGPRSIIAPGVAFVAAGLLLLTQIGPDQPYYVCVLPAVLLIGIGSGLFFSITAHVIVSEIRSDMVGIASATGLALNAIGQSVAAPLLGAVSASVAHTSGMGAGYIATFVVSGVGVLVVAGIAGALFRPGPLVQSGDEIIVTKVESADASS